MEGAKCLARFEKGGARREPLQGGGVRGPEEGETEGAKGKISECVMEGVGPQWMGFWAGRKGPGSLEVNCFTGWALEIQEGEAM